MELSLIRNLMDKDFYDGNKGTRGPDKLFTKDVQKIKHAIDNATRVSLFLSLFCEVRGFAPALVGSNNEGTRQMGGVLDSTDCQRIISSALEPRSLHSLWSSLKKRLLRTRFFEKTH